MSLPLDTGGFMEKYLLHLGVYPGEVGPLVRKLFENASTKPDEVFVNGDSWDEWGEPAREVDAMHVMAVFTTASVATRTGIFLTSTWRHLEGMRGRPYESIRAVVSDFDDWSAFRGVGEQNHVIRLRRGQVLAETEAA